MEWVHASTSEGARGEGKSPRPTGIRPVVAEENRSTKTNSNKESQNVSR